MAAAPIAVASAVILPDAEETPPIPSLKRRQSSLSDNNSKRRRLSHDEEHSKQESESTPPTKADAQNGRLAGGQAAEERKRGRRLFGALLGTLSQGSSSSTAQKRRSDIEKKQQAKLKQQIEEEDGRAKEKLEALMHVRRKEQRIYDKQSMKIRHSNLLAQAHSLRTKAEPHLFYKPWKSTADDETTIKAQIKDAEAKIEMESTQWDADNPPPIENSEETEPAKVTKVDENVEMKMVGEDAGKEAQPERNISPITNGHDPPPTDEKKPVETSEATNRHGAEGEEMVEGEEDTVIY